MLHASRRSAPDTAPHRALRRTAPRPVASIVDVVRLFDSHCHLHDERIPGGDEAAVASAHAAGVTAMVTVGCDRQTSLAAIETAARFDSVYPTVGLHPHDAASGIDTVLDLTEHPDIVAIGEAGLDYFYDHSDRAVQRQVFAEQIQIAHERRLPLIIHTRDAWTDTFEILSAEGTPDGTIFHCFTGGVDEATRCLDLGAYLSFSGIVTFPSASDVQAAAEIVPLDRLLIETDAPYLAPVPHRGKTNQPAWVVDIAQFIADRRDVGLETVAEASFDNARRLFLPAAHD